MDEDLAYFYRDKGFGPAIQAQQVPDSSLKRFEGKLPGQLLEYWRRFGWCGFGQGIFWLVNPDDYEAALEAWIGDMPLMEVDAYYVVGRSAFGDLFLWGTGSGPSLTIKSTWGMLFPRDNSRRMQEGKSDQLAKSFLVGQKKSDLDQKDHLDKPLFDRALKRLGPLSCDEMYAFEPALAAGGTAALQSLRKVKCVEHLVMLAQLGARQLMRDIVKDAKSAGLM